MFLEANILLQGGCYPWHQYDVRVHGALSVTARAHTHTRLLSLLAHLIAQVKYFKEHTPFTLFNHIKTVTRVRVQSSQSLKICLGHPLILSTQ